MDPADIYTEQLLEVTVENKPTAMNYLTNGGIHIKLGLFDILTPSTIHAAAAEQRFSILASC